MVKKIFAAAISMFIIYSVFVAFFAPVWWHSSQHQWQDNVIKAQKYIYNENEYFDNLILGSSLSCRLVMDSLPNTYNLSFAGQSIYDGLKLATRGNKLPKNIFIEMNVALRQEDIEFTSMLTSPLLYFPKKEILSLREDKQPLAILGTQMTARFMTDMVRKLKFILNIKPELKNNHDELFQKMLALQQRNYTELPSQKIIDVSFNTLKKYVTELKTKKVNIYFFEIPVNAQLNNLPKANLIRKSFYSNFPRSEFDYIDMPYNIIYNTTDGVHLEDTAALNYTLYLKSQIEYYTNRKGNYNNRQTSHLHYNRLRSGK